MNPEEQQKPKDQSSYDFILNAQEPPPPSFMARLNKKHLIIFGAILGAILIIALMIMSTINTQANNEQKDRLVAVAQYQTEIGRIAEIGAEKAEDSTSQTLAEEIKSSMDESLEITQQLLRNRGANLDDVDFQAKENGEIDTQLDDSVESNNFDKTFDEIIKTNLEDYQLVLTSTENKANDTEKMVLQEAYNEAVLILEQID